MVAYSRRPGHDISEPVAIAPVKVPLVFEFLYLLQHLLSLFLQFLQVFHVLLLKSLLLSAVARRGFCITLSLFVRFL